MRKSVVFFLVLLLLGIFFVPRANSFAQMIGRMPQAVILVITPRAVTLQQGGPAATITVDGKFLETILGIQVIRGGQSMRGITTKLVQPWPASRKIELQAGAVAPVAKDYQLRFIGKAGLKEFKIDVPLAVFSLAVAGKPINQMQAQVPLSTLPNQTQITYTPSISPVSRNPQAEIIAVKPKAVSLDQGGSPAVVTVDGKYLETIQGIQVIRGGQSMRGITTKLVQPWPASRRIELKATANAPVGPGYQLQFIGKAGLKEFKVDVSLTVFSLEVAGKKPQIQQATLPPQTLSTNAPPVNRANNEIEKMILDYLEHNPDAVDTVEGISEFWQQRKVEITFTEISYTLEKLMKKGLIQTFLKADGKHYYKLKLPQQKQALILSITPKAVSLDQGGSPVVVTVDGKYLETILSVQVIRKGRGVGEISARLVQPWPASKKIELQATANAPVGPGYQLAPFSGKGVLSEWKLDVPSSVFSLEVVGKPINQLQVQVPLSTLPNQTQTSFMPPGTSLALEGALTVTSPNGGEAWDIRASFLQRISWQSRGSVGSSVKIELYRGETKVLDIKDSSPNTGVLYWEPPDYISYATDYRIKITSLTNPLITDMSDQSFALGILPGTKAIEVLFKRIQVIDDKDPVGPGELWFEFYVNDKLCGRKPSSQTYSINDNSTQESNIDFNDLSCTIAISEDQAVRIKVIGMDDDAPLPNESLGTAEWHESISILENRSPYQFYTIKSEDPYCFFVTFQVWIR